VNFRVKKVFIMPQGRKPWNKDPTQIENICQRICSHEITDVSQFKLEWIGVSPYRRHDGNLSGEEKIKLMFMRAKSYLQTHEIPVTSRSIVLAIKMRQLNFETRATKEHKKNYTEIAENLYRTKPPKCLDTAGICHCGPEELCGAQSGCINRYVYQ
jgi:hypothetical protein